MFRRLGRAAASQFGRLTSGVRCRPDYLLIGAKRGGTTSLFRRLEQLPGQLTLWPSPRLFPMRDTIKGVHFFDLEFHRGVRWYFGHFPTTLTAWLRRRRVGYALVGEASPYHLFHPCAAGRAHAALPDAKIVVMLRDPVERTISHWSEQRRNGVEQLSLAEALAAEADRLGDDHRRLASGELAVSFAHENQSYAAQSHYPEALQRWVDLYGRDRVFVTESERFYAETDAVVDELCDFLGVPRHHLATPAKKLNDSERGDVDPDVRRNLEARFRADIAPVTELLGRPVSWAWATEDR